MATDDNWYPLCFPYANVYCADEGAVGYTVVPVLRDAERWDLARAFTDLTEAQVAAHAWTAEAEFLEDEEELQ